MNAAGLARDCAIGFLPPAASTLMWSNVAARATTRRNGGIRPVERGP